MSAHQHRILRQPRSRHRIAVGLLMAVVMFAGHGNAAEVTAKASTDSVQVAEPFTLEICVSAPDGAKVTFPTISDKLGEFDVRGSQDAFDVPVQDARTWTRRFTLESIATGDVEIPSLDIQVNESGNASAVQTHPIIVRVASVLEDRSDPTKFRDIQSVVDVDVPIAKSNAWVLWGLGGVLSMTMLAIATGAVSRRGKWLTPKDWAIEELDELGESVDASTVDSESAMQKISNVARNYLLLEFGIDDAGRTPQELVQEIVAGKQINAETTHRLSGLFTMADRARFAGMEISKAGIRSAIQNSRELIHQIATEINNTPNQPHP